MKIVTVLTSSNSTYAYSFAFLMIIVFPALLALL